MSKNSIFERYNNIYYGKVNIDSDSESICMSIELVSIDDLISVLKKTSEFDKEIFLDNMVEELERKWEEVEDDLQKV